MKGSVRYLNPEGLHKNAAFTQAVIVTGHATTIYVGGQNSVDASGNIVGEGDLKAQAERALRNIEIALTAAGARLDQVVKWNVYILQGQPLKAGFEAFLNVWGRRLDPPAISSFFVAGLAHPKFLVEIDAIAVIPEE